MLGGVDEAHLYLVAPAAAGGDAAHGEGVGALAADAREAHRCVGTHRGRAEFDHLEEAAAFEVGTNHVGDGTGQGAFTLEARDRHRHAVGARSGDFDGELGLGQGRGQGQYADRSGAAQDRQDA